MGRFFTDAWLSDIDANATHRPASEPCIVIQGTRRNPRVRPILGRPGDTLCPGDVLYRFRQGTGRGHATQNFHAFVTILSCRRASPRPARDSVAVAPDRFHHRVTQAG